MAARPDALRRVERELLRGQERVEPELDAAEVREPDREPERTRERKQPSAVHEREIVEHGMRDRLELRQIRDAHRPARGEGAETLVLPACVRMTLMCDLQAAMADTARDARVAKERADDDLQLDAIRREPAQRGIRTLQHVVSYRPSLERAPIVGGMGTLDGAPVTPAGSASRPDARRAPAPPYTGEGPHALWHISDDFGITHFEPRVSTATPDDKLVWAVDTRHLPLFWFPRECPRGTFWAGERTSDDDVEFFLSGRRDLRVHAIDADWHRRLKEGRVVAYRMPEATFEPDPVVTGYWRSREAVTPIDAVVLKDLIGLHAAAGIELRVVLDLWSVWDRIIASTLEYSGIRLRNAVRAG